MRTTILASIAALALSSGALASPITFQFDGVVTNVFSGSPALGAPWNTAGAVVGSPVQLTYTFESSTPDSNAGANFGTYLNAVSAYSLKINTTSQSVTGPAAISILESWPAGYDQYEMNFYGFTGTSGLSFQLDDNTNSSFATDALPTSLNLSTFSLRQGDLVGGVPFGQTIRFRVDTLTILVPEPTTLAAAALGAVTSLKRRRRAAC
ncbi:MAG: PEP-CTERM sorting domain-containing protein [Tepidisphaeraceae bacterium]